ncbi:FMN-binding glutamate synthase family protein [Psychrosphaera sp. B3R10]|uniref:FMN-binding glutamate synthase family protein n=1 Tax=unclassified Psychrosphaera TaxID=2641570 RepID=UPI001C088A4C|nr:MULTISPECIES: FMN-binding glutamate synthase family protein [unclassified Psychrosphaera]MBU2883979.1 FMN-binding glutamate synthase family protein [Psychrosphaera sp. I2R16]MBU2989908.1 FMN-binding glutamate synthase family protein [Psychrosphaera sp. B3R10]
MTTAQRVLWIIATFGNALAIFLLLNIINGWTVSLMVFTSLYTLIGLHDITSSRHTLNRLYPVLAYFRYFFESIRIEIQQYFIANDIEEMPFNREQRNLVYRRAKGVSDTIPFGTQRDLMQTNYQSIWHSMAPKVLKEESKRIRVGSSQCKKPYLASRLNISAMSYGALSAEAIQAMNFGAKQGDFYHNTGEGGISAHHLKHGGDLVWQLGTGLFGCRDDNGRFSADDFAKLANLEQVKMIEIKLSQGAKPGHGGVLPKAKITDEIAVIRGISKEHDCVSPPMNPEFSTPLELLSFVSKLRELSGGKPIGIKLCIGNPAEFLCLGKAMIETGVFVDFITVDGAEGGTGAAPVEFSNRLGLMCLEGVYFVNNVLVGLGIRSEIKVIASGKTASGFDIVNKVAFGADMVNAARTFMMSVGCIQSKQCDTNKCPTGIATQDKNRSKAIDVERKAKRVASFQHHTLHSFYELLGAMGLDEVYKLTYNMVKRRTPNGMLESNTHTVPELKTKQLLNDALPGMWQIWWSKARSDSFYIEDTAPVHPPELDVRNIS